MASRMKKKGNVPNIFENNPRENPQDDNQDFSTSKTHEDLFPTFSGYAMDNAANRRHIKQEYVEIDRISPDTSQPRRAIPAVVRGAKSITAGNLPGMFERWVQLVNEGRETAFELHKHLVTSRTNRDDAVIAELDRDDAAETDTDSDLPPLEASLMRVVDLAASIRQDGLLNSITVTPIGTGYVIETGERRWLAVHLLRWHFGVDDSNHRGDLKWDKIPAIIVKEPNVWRQAAENNVRDNLNAISKARQLALLLMDIHQADSDFQPIEAFEEDQDFYAQVANGYKYRIPAGMGEKLAGVLGLSSPKQVRDYRRLLKIDGDLWTTADDEDWTEGAIRDAVSGAAGSVPNGTLAKNKPTKASVPNGTLDERETMPKPVQRLYKAYANPKQWHKLPAQQRREVYDYLGGLLQQMQEMGFDD